MIKAAVIGYGNIGKSVLEAIASAPDMELAGIVRRSSSLANQPEELKNKKVTDNIDELGKIDVAILCVPTRSIPETAKTILKKGINTVDSYDIHSGIWGLKQDLQPIAEQGNSVAIISAGWDPGSDSVVRTLMEIAAPKGITYTNFGPGMSMGHTVAVKAVNGVKDALSMTIPLGTGIHRRMVYVEIEDGADFEIVQKTIKDDAYFKHDETHVFQVPSVDVLKDMGHGVSMTRKGVSGSTQNQLFDFGMRINNPALTAQIMVACARASIKMQAGTYTMIEIPLINMLYGNTEDLINRLV